MPEGPYIVTTKRPARADWARFAHASVSRLAVATLEQKDVAPVLFNWREGDQLSDHEYRVLDAIYEMGGRLPDGTVIEVERTTRRTLLEALLIDEGNLPSSEWPWTTQRLCDAYNAQQKSATPTTPSRRYRQGDDHD